MSRLSWIKHVHDAALAPSDASAAASLTGAARALYGAWPVDAAAGRANLANALPPVLPGSCARSTRAQGEACSQRRQGRVFHTSPSSHRVLQAGASPLGVMAASSTARRCSPLGKLCHHAALIN